MSLFKYYSAVPEYTISTLRDKTIFFAKPMVLNDPFDVSAKTIVEFKLFCEKLQWNKRMADSLNNHGIFSMSRGKSVHPDNFHLWCLYASNFNGFVVEFDEDKLNEHITQWGYYINDVQYVEHPLDLDDEHAEFEIPSHEDGRYKICQCFEDIKYCDRLFEYLHLQKRRDVWSTENECRIIIGNRQHGVIQVGNGYKMILPEECFRNLYIGWQVKEEKKQELIQIAHTLGIKTYIATPKIINKDWNIDFETVE